MAHWLSLRSRLSNSPFLSPVIANWRLPVPVRSTRTCLALTDLFDLDTNSSARTGAQTLSTITLFESNTEALQLSKLCVIPDEVMILNAYHIEYSCHFLKAWLSKLSFVPCGVQIIEDYTFHAKQALYLIKQTHLYFHNVIPEHNPCSL